MNHYVCVKHVPDTAARITVLDGHRIDPAVNFVLNPYDEIAVQAAVDAQKKLGGQVVAICLGPEAAINTLRSAVAMGAQRAILIRSEAMPGHQVIARALAKVIADLGEPGMIYCGRESIDAYGMQTPCRLGALLDLPVLNAVVSLEVDAQTAKAACEREAGARQELSCPVPCVVGCAKGLNQPNYPMMPDIMRSKRATIEEVSLDSLGLGEPTGGVELLGLEAVSEARQPVWLSTDPQTAAHELARILRDELKVIG